MAIRASGQSSLAFTLLLAHQRLDSRRINIQTDITLRQTAGIGLSIHIRPMRLEDVPQVHLIDRLSFSMPWPENAFRYELSQNSYSLCRVAEAALPDGKQVVVAETVIWLIMDEAHIATIAVHPDYRHQGISRLLLVTVLQECIRRGARLATLEVRANNQIAQALYRRFRFEVVGRRPRYYRDNNEDALIMTADLVQSVDAQDKTTYLEWLESGQWINQDHSASTLP